MRPLDAHLPQLVAQAGMGVNAIDAGSGVYVDVDDAFCALLTYPRDELLGRSPLTVIHPDDVERVAAWLAELRLGSASATSSDLRYLRRNGELVRARVTRSPGDGVAPTGLELVVPYAVPAGAAAALRGAEAPLATLIRTTLWGIVIVRRSDRVIVEVNDALATMLGWSRHEVLGRTTADLGVYVDPAAPADLYRAIETAGIVPRRPVTLRDRSGSPHDFVITMGTLDLGGEPCLIGFLEDVTELNRMNAALRASQDQFRAMFEVAPVGLAQAEMATQRLRWFNVAMCELTGYSADELAGMTIDALTHPDDRAADAELFGRVRRGELAIGQREKRYLRKDGRVVWVAVTLRMLSDGRGPTDTAMAVVVDITDRQRADQIRRLQTSALQATDSGIVITDTEGTVQWSNDAFGRLTGYPAAAMLGRNPRILKSGQQGPEFYRELWTTIASGRTWHGELVNRRSDGQLYDEEMTINPVRDAAGTITHFIAIKQDITARKRAAAALLEAEERYRLALGATGLGTWRYDLEAGQIHLDARARRHFGIDHSVASMAELLSAVHADDVASLRAAIATSLAPSGPGRLVAEHRVVHPGGKVRWVVVHTRLIFAGEGATRKAQFVIATTRDVTDEKIAADDLRASDDRYRALVDNLEEVVFSVDLAGVLTFVNLAVTRFGYVPEDMVGRPIEDFVHPGDRARLAQTLPSQTTDHPPGPQERRWLDAAGKVRVLRTSTRPLVVAGRTVGLTGLATDITAQRETEEQLRSAQRMEAIGRLAGGVAHDFNNMLSVILSYSELVLDELGPDNPLSDHVQQVVEASMRAAELTRQLLAFSRRQVLQPEAVELAALVAGLTKMLRRLIGEDVTLTVDSDDDLFTIKMDRGQLEQVLMNLAVNARDAMPDGGELTIAARNTRLDGARAATFELDPGDYVELTVTDTGVGMTPDVLARIFEPFFTTKPVGRGTGLGLATVHGIVKQSGAGIAVRSEPGGGTSFQLLFPRMIEAPSRWIEPEAPAARPSGGPERILVVEDEVALRHVVERVLRAAGYQVLVAASADAALLLCEQYGPQIDLVLTDVVMPGMNGRVLAERLAPLCPGAKVIFMSGYDDEMIAHHDVLDRAFIRKPFDRAALAAKVRAVLDSA